LTLLYSTFSCFLTLFTFENSKQAAKLGSHFSLMMLVDVPKQSVEELKTKLRTMSDMNASVYEANEERKPTPKIGCAY
jgi:glycine cleavage system regulatory protein